MSAFQQLKRLGDVCEEVAERRGIPICVTVVDAHGHTVLLHRMPGSPVLALEMAERKAYTSVVMGMETNALTSLVQPGQPLYTLTSYSRLVAFGGGSRVLIDGDAFGVGISGGTTQEDMEILRDARLQFAQGEWAADSMS